MSRTLLLADDSVVIQKLVGLSFANEDIEIVTVDNGDDAVARAIEIKPDLVLADVVMPGKSGYEVCSAVRQNAELANTPVLLLTGTFEAFDEGRAKEVGASGFITKPFEANALVQRVNELLASVKAPATPAPPAASDEFFDENLGDLGASILDTEPVADASAAGADDFAFGSSEHEPLAAEHDLASGEIIFPESTSPANSADVGLNDLLDGAGGDRTIAMMPEPTAPMAATASEPAISPPPIIEPAPIAAPPINPITSESPALQANAMLLEDDLVGAPCLGDPGETVLAGDAFADPSIPDFSDPGTSIDPLADPLGDAGAISFDSDFGSTDPLSNSPALETDSLSFGSAQTNPIAGGAPMAPFPNETVLAADFFTEAPSAADSNDSFEMAPPPVPVAEPLQSNGLDLDFGEAPSASASTDPVFSEDFDVSASDLADAPLIETAEPEPVLAAPVVPTPEVAALDPVVNPFATTVPDPGSSQGTSFPASPSAPFASEEAIRGTSSSEVAPSAGTSTPDLSPMMRERIHDTLEKVAWEAFSDLSENIARQVLERVEQVAWEVIPQMAEALIQEEIRRMKDGKE